MGHTKLAVRDLGKLATLLLYLAVAWFFVAAEWEWLTVLAWAVGIPGLILYYVVAFQYAGDAATAIRARQSANGSAS